MCVQTHTHWYMYVHVCTSTLDEHVVRKMWPPQEGAASAIESAAAHLLV